MKSKDIKSLLKSEANKVEIKDFTSQILAAADFKKRQEEVVLKSEKKHFNIFTKILAPTVSLVLACLLIWVFIPSNNPGPVKPTPPINQVTRAKKLIGYEVLQGTTIIDSSNSIVRRAFQDMDDFKTECNRVHKYLVNAEMIMNKDEVDIDIAESKVEGYKYLMTFTYADVSGNDSFYEFYYNEEALNEADDDEEDLDEISTEITGLLKIDSKEYIVNGEKEVEKKEFSIELTFKNKTNPNSYFTIKQETSKGENDYEYVFVHDGKTKTVEQEIENHIMSLVLTDYDSTKYEYEFVFNKKKINFEIENKGEVFVTINKDHYLYKSGEYEYPVAI